MKQKIRLTESDLHRIVKESVNKILMEQVAQESVKDLWDSERYYVYVGAHEDDFIYEEIAKGDEDRYRAYCKWTNDVHFDPIVLGYFYGSYDDPDIEADDRSIKAFEYELSKLDSCPVFNKNEIQRIKEYINEEIDTAIDKGEWEDILRSNDY